LSGTKTRLYKQCLRPKEMVRNEIARLREQAVPASSFNELQAQRRFQFGDVL